VFCNIHHIAADGWSMGVLTRDFSQYYMAAVTSSTPELAPLGIQYADYACWQHAHIERGGLEAPLNYWRNGLANLPSLHSLRSHQVRPAIADYDGARHYQTFCVERRQKIEALANSLNCTVFMLLECVLACTLSKYSRQTDIVIGTASANRKQSSLAPLIGFFVNTLVLRHDLSDDPTLIDALAESKNTVLRAFENEDVPFELLVDDQLEQRDFSHAPLVQVLFAVQNNEQAELQLPELTVSTVDGGTVSARFDLALSVDELDGGYSLMWEYATAVFDRDIISTLAEGFEFVLDAFLSDLTQRLSGTVPREALSAGQVGDLASAGFDGETASAAEALGVDAASLCFALSDDDDFVVPRGARGQLCFYEGQGGGPLADGELPLRVWRSDAVALMDNDGHVVGLGGVDDYVQHDGYTCDLYALASLVRQMPDVQDAVARLASRGTESAIALYVTIDEAQSGPAVIDAITDRIVSRCPKFLQPQGIAIVSAATLGAIRSGAAEALPEPTWRSDPGSDLHTYKSEEGLLKIWRELLGNVDVKRDDDIFDLGGNSLLCVRLEFAINDVFQVDVSVKDLFTHPVFVDQAALIDSRLRTAEKTRIPAVARDAGDLLLSYAQQRLWIIEQMTEESALYNMPLALRLSGPLDVASVTRAMNTVIERHEVLRTNYLNAADGTPVQQVDSPSSIDLHCVDLSNLGESEQAARVQTMVADEAVAPFDLGAGLKVRACLAKLHAQEHVLLITMHHIASDGWSLGVLVNEFASAYAAYRGGQTPELPTLPIQYADFAQWQRQWMKSSEFDGQLAYWQAALQDMPMEHGLALDRPRP
ncbi:MAG: condensation domain-containing protein, partial [Pseudomonadota bacterium]